MVLNSNSGKAAQPSPLARAIRGAGVLPGKLQAGPFGVQPAQLASQMLRRCCTHYGNGELLNY